MKKEKTRIIELPKFLDRRGNISIIAEIKNIPFKIKRTHWVYDVPGGEKRGGHAYKVNEEFIVALSGSFDVVVDDGNERITFSPMLLPWFWIQLYMTETIMFIIMRII